MFISVIVPAYNEEESIIPLLNTIINALKEIGKPYEIICIDDGSIDNTYNNLVEAKKKLENITIIRFRKNFGKSPALDAGFREANGEIVVTMDADLQDDPRGIIPAIEKLDEGYDMVSGWKQERHDPISKTLPSKIFNFIVSKISGIKLHDFNCGFKVYRKEVIKEIHLYGEHHRFIPVIAHNRGFKVAELPVVHHSRKFGKSKFGLERFLRGFFDLITISFISEYSSKPLHLIGGIGLLSSILGFMAVLYLEINKYLFGITIGTRPLLTLGVFMVLFGLQLIVFGLLAEMVTYSSKRDREQYCIKGILR